MWPWMELGLGLRLVELLSELFLQCTQSLSPFLPSPIDMIVKNRVTSLSFSHFSLICLSFEGSTVHLQLSESRQGTSVLPNQAAGTPWSSISFAPGTCGVRELSAYFFDFMSGSCCLIKSLCPSAYWSVLSRRCGLYFLFQEIHTYDLIATTGK